MEIFYCKNCRARVSSTDIANGKGIQSGDKIFCAECVKKLGIAGLAKQAKKKKPKTRITTTTNRIPRKAEVQAASAKPARRAGHSVPVKKGMSPGLLIGIILGAGALVGLVVGLIMKSRTEVTEVKTTQEYDITSKEEPEPEKKVVPVPEPEPEKIPESKPEPKKKPEPKPEPKPLPKPKPEPVKKPEPPALKPGQIIDFENGMTGTWETNKDTVTISDTKAHSGSKSLFMPPNSWARLKISEKDVYGRFTVWVYESGVSQDDPKKHADGPLWGFKNSTGQSVKIGVKWRSFTGGNNTMIWWSSANKYAVHHLGHNPQRTIGWHKWEFIFEDDTGPKLVYDGKQTVKAMQNKFKDEFKGEWKGGFNQIIFNGGSNNIMTDENAFYFDDIEITVKK